MGPSGTNTELGAARELRGDGGPEPTEEVAEVRSIFAALDKTSRVFVLYPPNNKIYVDFTTNLTEKIRSFLSRRQTLPLSIFEDSIEYEKHPVYEEENRARSIAMKLFRDGVRKLVFYDGISKNEVIGLLDVLTRQPDADSLEDDMVTLLWEKDFSHISYYVLDDPYADEDPPDLQKEVKQTTDSGGADGPKREKSLGSELSTRTLSAVLTISDHDLEAAKAMIAQENGRNLRHDLTTLLFELLVIQKDPETFRNTVEVLGRLVQAYVGTGGMGEAVSILRKFREFAEEDLPEEMKEALRKELDNAGGPAALKELAGLFEQPIIKSSKVVSEFLRLLGPKVIPGLINLLPRARNTQVLISVLSELAKEDPEPLIERVRDRDPTICRQVIGILGSLRDEKLVSHLLPQLRHPTVAVRLETVRALGRLGGVAAVRGLLQAVRDSEYQVRTLALRSIAENGVREAAPALREIVESKEFLDRNLYEKQEFYRTLASIQPEEAIEMFARILGRSSFFKRAKPEENRVAAASALAFVGTTEARELLAENLTSDSRAVREACELALKRMDREEHREPEAE